MCYFNNNKNNNNNNNDDDDNISLDFFLISVLVMSPFLLVCEKQVCPLEKSICYD